MFLIIAISHKRFSQWPLESYIYSLGHGRKHMLAILLTTLYNVCAVPWGDILSTVGGYLEYRGGKSWVPWGDILSTVGGYLEYRGGISWVPWGDILSTVGGYLEYRGGISWVPWGDILSTVGGYLEYRGGISWVPWGDILSTVGGYLEYRGGISWVLGGYLEYRGGYLEYRGGYLEYRGISWVPGGTQITKDFPPRYSRFSPHGTQDSPPTVLKISPHGTQDFPPRYSRFPPTVLKISPHGTADYGYNYAVQFIARNDATLLCEFESDKRYESMSLNRISADKSLRVMQVSIWQVTIPPGTPGLLHQNVCPAPGLLHNRKCPGAGPINNDVPGAGHLHQHKLLTQSFGLKN